MKSRKKRSIVTVGRDKAEIRIYTLRAQGGYESFQCSWYELGQRRTKTFGALDDARLFAQQKTVAIANGLPEINEVTLRDVEVLKGCERRVGRLGFTLPAAVEEWLSAKESLREASLAEVIEFYKRHHAGIPRKTVNEVLPLFFEAKEAAKVSDAYLRVSRCYMVKFREQFGPVLIADITTPEIDRYLRATAGAAVTKNNIRRNIVTLFTWAPAHGCRPDRPSRAAPQGRRRQDGCAPPAARAGASLDDILAA